jgi:hypothetical protein
LEARRRGFDNFAISNYCVHNSLPVKKLPPEFWRCAEYLRIKWQKQLPLKSCCVTLYPQFFKMWQTRAALELWHLRKRHQKLVSQRLANPATVLKRRAHKHEIKTEILRAA